MFNIELSKLNSSKPVKPSQETSRAKPSAYFQMNRSYSKYFSYTPNVVEKHRKSPFKPERCKSAVNRKLNPEEQKLKADSIKIIKIIKQRLRRKQKMD